MLRTQRMVLMIGSALGLGLWGMGAWGQNALGDGTALDANTGVGSAGRNVTVRQPDFRVRNLLITGNVAGGRGFRGTVGYLGENDFRGELGSDDLFLFRSYGALSTLPYVQQTAATPEAIGLEYGLVEYRREFLGATVPTVQQGAFEQDRLFREGIQRQMRVDEVVRDRYMLGNPLQGEARPDTLAVYSTQEGDAARVVASPIRGLQVEPMVTDVGLLGLTAYDEARLIEDQLAGAALTIGQPFQPDLSLYREREGRVEGSMLSSTITRSVTEEYDELMRTMSEALIDDPGVEESGVGAELGAQLAGLSDWLEGLTPEEFQRRQRERLIGSVPTPDTGALATRPPWETHEPTPDPTQIPGTLPTRRDSDDEPRATVRAAPEGLPEGIDLNVLRHGREITILTPRDRNRLTELLAAGEANLRNGEYFEAEADFVRALRMQPEHPLAMAGLANAQLGAQVFASAALRLRELFIKHPEMIDVRYGGALLPQAERLRADADLLRGRLEERSSLAAALLIAYIGKQLGDRELIDEGLTRMREMDERDPLVPALRVIWLGEQPARTGTLPQK